MTWSKVFFQERVKITFSCSKQIVRIKSPRKILSVLTCHKIKQHSSNYHLLYIKRKQILYSVRLSIQIVHVGNWVSAIITLIHHTLGGSLPDSTGQVVGLQKNIPTTKSCKINTTSIIKHSSKMCASIFLSSLCTFTSQLNTKDWFSGLLKFSGHVHRKFKKNHGDSISKY